MTAAQKAIWAVVWFSSQVYRAKPAPMVKSVWVNVYADAAFGGLDVSAFHSEREEADVCAQRCRISVARFDLIDGVLSVELEPLDEEPE